MKNFTLMIGLILAGYISHAQDCGSYIELLGTGITGQSEYSIQVDDPGSIDSITAEVIYKSTTAPGNIKLWSASEEFTVKPADIPISGWQGEGVITSVFRAIFHQPAEMINLDILNNPEEFYSIALYIHRNSGPVVSYMEGSLYHVYQNEDFPQLTDIPLVVSENPRNITLRFGITELNKDERWAEFRFEASGETKALEVWEWNPDINETESYTVREVMFENIPGDVDNIVMTMLSENHEPDTLKGDSFIAGVVLVDIPCEYEESGSYCSYTQGFYGNAGGKTCAGETTRELLSGLLYEDLILGSGDYTFTIPAGSVDCVLDILPGGGPSKALNGQYRCDDLGDIAINKQGRLQNSLLAQGITLALNLRNCPNLKTFQVNGTEFRTLNTEDCKNPESGEITGTEKTHSFGSEIVDFLGADATCENILDLVNKALAGKDISPLTLSHIADAAAVINEAFDECVIVLDAAGPDFFEESDEGEESSEGEDKRPDGYFNGLEANGTTGVPDSEIDKVISIYPNPAREIINLQTKEPGNYSIVINSLNGQCIHTGEFNGESLQIDLSSLQAGIYFLTIRSDQLNIVEKVIKQ